MCVCVNNLRTCLCVGRHICCHDNRFSGPPSGWRIGLRWRSLLRKPKIRRPTVGREGERPYLKMSPTTSLNSETSQDIIIRRCCVLCHGVFGKYDKLTKMGNNKKINSFFGLKIHKRMSIYVNETFNSHYVKLKTYLSWKELGLYGTLINFIFSIFPFSYCLLFSGSLFYITIKTLWLSVLSIKKSGSFSRVTF